MMSRLGVQGGMKRRVKGRGNKGWREGKREGEGDMRGSRMIAGM